MEQTKSTRILIALGVLLLLIIVGYSYYRSTLILTSTTPKNHSQNVDEISPISLNFNHPMKDASLTKAAGTNYLTITPFAKGSVAVKGGRITFTPSESLASQTNYTLRLNNVVSQDGKTHQSITLQFTTGYTPWNKLPKAVQQHYLNQTDQGNTQVDPNKQKLIDALPVTKDDFAIDYLAGSDTFAITIGTPPAGKSEQEALDYIKSFNVDPASLTISYYIQPTAR